MERGNIKMTVNQYIALGLLLGRIVTVILTAMVIRKQYRVLKTKKYPELKMLRRNLMLGTIILLIGNFIPIVIDTLGIFNRGSFSLLLAYVFSNNITAILASFMLWYNIRLSERTKLLVEE